jgi:hypothetical protein
LDDKEVEKQWKCALKFIERSKDLSSPSRISENRFITKKINDNLEIFYYGDLEDKKIGRYYLKIKELQDGGFNTTPIFTNIIIDAIPKIIFVYKNNPLLQEPRTNKNNL